MTSPQDAGLDARIARLEALGEADPQLTDPKDLSVMCEVAAGPFVMGVAEGEADKPDEAPERVVVIERFLVDPHLVTVAAYRRFVDDGGYARRACWSNEGWRWRLEGSTSRSETLVGPVDRPRFWDDPAWAVYGSPNRPVVGVSFWEAEAFARWAGKRLPSEAEWEKVARGEDGRRYPWGDDWEPDRCAHREVGPRSTVPIGCFPRGRSACGAFDLLGSVWQWCADWYGPYDPHATLDPTGPDDGETKVVRGGAWNTLASSCRATNRNAFPPHARFSNVGFRCVA
ncbi:MAG: SUMF1/EgtB/PvdO family nonheme iron enzyme, partial [Deltaproteobacteria bacterium]|nr:SUMF1/EgtB/PvdO family nonheme iron enzyme [Deltaproteobacteria bacterium]